jgi:hypothetical protein
MERKQDVRRFKPVNIVIWTLVTVLAIAALSFFVISRSSGEAVIDTSENLPIAGQVESATTSLVAFEEPQYKLLLPSDWVEKERRADRYYDYVTYESTGAENTGRTLSVYRNYNRDVPAVTRIIPITVVGDRILAQSISEQCYRYTDLSDTPLDEPALSKWDNVEFMCDPEKLHHIVGVGTEEKGFGVDLKGQHFTLIYTDHSAQQDDSIFYGVLNSFEAK